MTAQEERDFQRYGDVNAYKGSRYAPVSNAPARPVFGRPLVYHETSQDRAREARRATVEPMRINYRPLGVAPAQIADRIHTLQSADVTQGTTVGVVRGSDGKIINVLQGAGGGTAYPTVLKVKSGSSEITLDATSGFTMTDGSHTLTILFSALARNISLQAAGYCDGGVKSIDTLRSASY